MSRRRSAAVAAVLAALPLLAGCGGGSSASGSGLRVVTSFYPLQYVVQRVAGDRAEVANLTQPGKEPHDVELSVRQTAELGDADLVVYEKGFQAAVDDAVAQSDPAHVLDAGAAADLEGDDPHFWLDPSRLARVADAVEAQLAEVDPEHADEFSANLEALDADLTALDRSLSRGLADCRVHTVVVSHDAFGYLGRRYGLDVVGINGLSPDAEPSPAHVRELQRLIRDDGITTVFSEELVSRELADSLAGDLGIRTAVLDPIEGLSDATAGEDYLSLMRANLRALQKGNRCT